MRTFLAIATLLMIALPVHADHCTTWSTSEPEIETAVFYVDNDFCQPCMWSIWVYQETNGIPGLQRGDEVHDDTCHGMIESDTIIF